MIWRPSTDLSVSSSRMVQTSGYAGLWFKVGGTILVLFPCVGALINKKPKYSRVMWTMCVSYSLLYWRLETGVDLLLLLSALAVACVFKQICLFDLHMVAFCCWLLSGFSDLERVLNLLNKWLSSWCWSCTWLTVCV